jgi:hypothetical protein
MSGQTIMISNADACSHERQAKGYGGWIEQRSWDRPWIGHREVVIQSMRWATSVDIPIDIDIVVISREICRMADFARRHRRKPIYVKLLEWLLISLIVPQWQNDINYQAAQSWCHELIVARDSEPLHLQTITVWPKTNQVVVAQLRSHS